MFIDVMRLMLRNREGRSLDGVGATGQSPLQRNSGFLCGHVFSRITPQAAPSGLQCWDSMVRCV